MSKFYRIVLVLIFGLFSAATFAGCGESESRCSLYRNNKLIKKSQCTIQECSYLENALERWDWDVEYVSIDIEGSKFRVNNKPGFSFQKGEQYCYGVLKNKREYYCRQ